MFDIQDIVQTLDLDLVYSRVEWTAPPATPSHLMYLHNQNEFLSGVVHLANAGDTVAFFKAHAPSAFPGSILMISDWSQELEHAVVFPENLTVFGFSDPLGALLNRMSEYLQAPFTEESSRQFSRYWSEIISNDNLTTDDIRSMLNQLPNAEGPFVQVCVVEFNNEDNKKIPYTLVMRHLLSLIPNSFGTVRDNEIILLITYRERRFDYPYDLDEIQIILKEYDGYLGFGYGTRDLASLGLLYKLLSRTIKLALQIHVGQELRIYTYERLGAYLTIDLAAIGFKVFTGSDALMYLAHPAIAYLTRYDAEKSSNLRAVLYFYLLSGKNSADTAKKLHMHRNTVMYKVKKACELCSLNLDDPHLCDRLLFSCQMAKYFEEMNRSKPTIHWAPENV